VRIRLGFIIAFAALTATGCSGGTGGVAAPGDVANGKKLFLGEGKCAACHILKAAGAQGTVGPNLDAAFGSDRAQGFDESTIRQVVADQIKFAGDYGTTGPTMPVDLVTGEDVDDVATYVASVAGRKSTGATTTTESTPTTTTTTTTGGGGGNLAAGKQAFMDNGCGACHTLAAAGSTGAIGPDLDKTKAYAKTANQPVDAFILESIVKPDAYIEKGYPKGVMPHTFASLPKTTLDALVAFIADSAKG
jgi:mono/diheme cytochrome c family protein